MSDKGKGETGENGEGKNRVDLFPLFPVFPFSLCYTLFFPISPFPFITP